MLLFILLSVMCCAHASLLCSTNFTSVKRKSLSNELLWLDSDREDSFKEYITTVYGEYPTNISFKYEFDYLYKRSDVQFRLDNPSRDITNTDRIYGSQHKYLDKLNEHYVFAFSDRKEVEPRKDYEWIEIMRGRTDCLLYQYIADDYENKKYLLSLYYEGFSRGWPISYSFGAKEPQPYGCWFWIAKGTGIFVNVGKTLVSKSWEETVKMLGLTELDDFDICKKVIGKGYDSIQLYHGHLPLDYAEFVFCTGKCATDPLKSACPPLELRTGWSATRECVCNDTFPIINCNNKITDNASCFDIKEPEHRLKQTCYFENFNEINTFETGWDGSIAILVLWDKNIQVLPKLKTVVNAHNQGGWSTIVVDSGLLLLNSVTNRTLETMNYVGFDIVPVLQKSEHAYRGKFPLHLLSLTVPGFLRSTVLKRAGVKIGFISYSIHSLGTDSLNKMVQLILDEALCLKRHADIIILLSASSIFADTYIAKKVDKFVDMIVGGGAQEHISCNDMWHETCDSVVLHSKREGSYIVKISIDVADKDKFAFKSHILEMNSVKDDDTVKNWMMERQIF